MRALLDGGSNGREKADALPRTCAVGGVDYGRCGVNDLHAHLCGMRDGLIAKMTAHLEIGGDVSGWLPLLAQTQATIEAVEAAIQESLTP